jgi:hypothetical protein
MNKLENVIHINLNAVAPAAARGQAGLIRRHKQTPCKGLTYRFPVEPYQIL